MKPTEHQLRFDHRYVDDDRVTADKLKDMGFVKDGFNAWNKCISPWPETNLKQLSFSGDYLYLREGELSKHRSKDDVVCLWNNDLRGVMPVKHLRELYFILTGSLLQSVDDLPF
jgi:hypothetical protein